MAGPGNDKTQLRKRNQLINGDKTEDRCKTD